MATCRVVHLLEESQQTMILHCDVSGSGPFLLAADRGGSYYCAIFERCISSNRSSPVFFVGYGLSILVFRV